jgi:hypothetical protein
MRPDLKIGWLISMAGFIAERIGPAAAQRLFDAKSHGDAKPFHFKLRRKDGSAVWVDVQGTPLYNAVGVFRGIVGAFSASK